MKKHLTPLAKTVLNYLQAKGAASTRDAYLDLGEMTANSWSRRITEIRNAGYAIGSRQERHPTTRRLYTVYTYGAHA